LGSRQRVIVNGFKPESGDTPKIVRNLLIMALRQSPLLSVIGDRTYLASDGSTLVNAGVALPLASLLASSRAEKVNLAIDGSVQNAGQGLQLVVNVYDPIAATPRYTASVAVPDRRDLVHLAELAAADLRVSAFGESGMHSTYVPLEQVTSSSPEAVDYYFRAVFAYEKSDATSALVLLDQALEIDPSFALAHHYRALTLTTQRMMEAAQESEEKAFAQRLRVTERERNWIDSQYFNITGAWMESAAALQKNTVLFPDEAVFERQLAFALTRLGRYEEAIPHNRRAVELDPFSDNNSSELLMNLAEANRVDECLAEARKFQSAGRTPSLIHSELALAYLQEGDYGRSLSECRLFEGGITERETWARLLSLPPLIMSGRFAEAVQLIEGDLALDSARPAGDREGSRTYMRRSALGQLQRLRDEPDLAAEQAEFLVRLPAVGANLIHLREGCALAFELNEVALAEQGLSRLRELAAKWPSEHSQSAVWLNQAMLKDLQNEKAAAGLFAAAKGAWPDPINLFYIARWEGKTNLLEAQLASLAEFERLRGKVFKHHFAGLVVLGWLEQAKCLQRLSRFDESLRMYKRVLEHWAGPQAAGSFIRQVRTEMDQLKRRLR
jgi:tetratricopeptide (TPR) repeat protein